MGDRKQKKDAKGSFAPSQADPKNNGVSSAKPRVITGRDDATMHVSEANKKPGNRLQNVPGAKR